MMDVWALAVSGAVVGVAVYLVVRKWDTREDRIYERELRMDDGELRRRLEGRFAPVIERVPDAHRLAIPAGPRPQGPPVPRRPPVRIRPRPAPAPPRGPDDAPAPESSDRGPTEGTGR